MNIADFFTIEIYEDDSGKCQYDSWLEKLDQKTAARIEARVSRFQQGNFGDHKLLENGGGVWEARLFFGPGYRLYFGKEKNRVVLLLCGGDKSTQKKDIENAKKFLVNWRNENA